MARIRAREEFASGLWYCAKCLDSMALRRAVKIYTPSMSNMNICPVFSFGWPSLAEKGTIMAMDRRTGEKIVRTHAFQQATELNTDLMSALKGCHVEQREKDNSTSVVREAVAADDRGQPGVSTEFLHPGEHRDWRRLNTIPECQLKYSGNRQTTKTDIIASTRAWPFGNM